jgi:hypothetical protein
MLARVVSYSTAWRTGRQEQAGRKRQAKTGRQKQAGKDRQAETGRQEQAGKTGKQRHEDAK